MDTTAIIAGRRLFVLNFHDGKLLELDLDTSTVELSSDENPKGICRWAQN